MSVRLRKWQDKKGESKKCWCLDVKFRFPDGRTERVRKAAEVNTRRGAEQEEASIRQRFLDRMTGREVTRIVPPMFTDFETDFLTYAVNNNKPSQVCAKKLTLKNHLRPAFGKKRLDEITVPEVEAYKAAKLKEGLAKKTVNNHLAVLRKMLNLAAEYDRLDRVPRIKQFRVEEAKFEFLTAEETERLLEATPPEWKMMVLVAVRTGLRLGELLALRWSDVDLVAGRLMVRRSLWQDQEGTPKSGRSREVALGDTVLEALRRDRGLKHLKDGYVFCRPDGTRLSHSEVKDVIPRICRTAELPKRLTWHDLRHSFASQLAMGGVTLKSIQELLGHGTIEMTMRYAHLSPDVKREAVRVLDRVRREPEAVGSPKLGHTGGT